MIQIFMKLLKKMSLQIALFLQTHFNDKNDRHKYHKKEENKLYFYFLTKKTSVFNEKNKKNCSKRKAH